MNDDFYGLANGLLSTWLPVRGSSLDSAVENWARTELRGELLSIRLVCGTAVPEFCFASEDGFFMSSIDESKHFELDAVQSFRLGSPALALAENGFNMANSPLDLIRDHMQNEGPLSMFLNGWRPYHPAKISISVLHDIKLENGDIVYGMYHNGTHWHQVLSQKQIFDAFGVTQNQEPLIEAQVFQVRYTSYYLKCDPEEFLV